MGDAGAFAGTSLPHRQSQTAKQYSACALLMLGLSMSINGKQHYQSGQLLPIAKRLLDISGGSAALGAIAVYEGVTIGDVSLLALAKKIFIDEVQWEDKGLFIALWTYMHSMAATTGDVSFIDAAMNPSKDLSMKKHLLDKTMFMERIGNSIMRPSANAAASSIPIVANWSRVTAVDAMEDALAQQEATRKEHFVAAGHGPPLVRSSSMGAVGALLSVMGPRYRGE